MEFASDGRNDQLREITILFGRSKKYLFYDFMREEDLLHCAHWANPKGTETKKKKKKKKKKCGVITKKPLPKDINVEENCRLPFLVVVVWMGLCGWPDFLGPFLR